MAKTYQERKEQIRQKAIQWQMTWYDELCDIEETMRNTEYFQKYGKRYGLIEEFKENGIID